MMAKVPDIGVLIGSITAAATALWIGVKAVWKMGSRITRILKLVESELTHNSGGSIKDAVGRIDRTVTTHEDKLDNLLLRVRVLDGSSWSGNERRSDSDDVGGVAV